jgi:hypothetical protein
MAVRGDGRTLELADERLQEDPEVAGAAVAQTPSALAWVHHRLKARHRAADDGELALLLVAGAHSGSSPSPSATQQPASEPKLGVALVPSDAEQAQRARRVCYLWLAAFKTRSRPARGG